MWAKRDTWQTSAIFNVPVRGSPTLQQTLEIDATYTTPVSTFSAVVSVVVLLWSW